MLWLKTVAVLIFTVSLYAGGQPAMADDRPFFWWNDPVGPDDTVQVSGANLSGLSSVTVEVLDDKGSATASQTADVVSVAPFIAKFIVPPGLARGVYRATLHYPETAKQIILNKPTVYWTQGDLGSTATPGGSLTVVGRNIARSPNARLELVSDTGTSVSLAPIKTDLWVGRFILPDDLKPGSYSARIYNGEGGPAGRVAAGTIEVAEAPVLPGPAATLKPSGGDDTASISTALAGLASRGGGVLLLEAGLYRMSGPVAIPPHVSLQGALRDDVVLSWLDDGPAMEALISGKSDFTISNLTIQSNKLVNVVKAGFREASEAQDGRNITLSGITMRVSYLLGHLSPEDAAGRMRIPDAFGSSTYGIALAGANHRIIDCDVLTTKSPLLLLRPINALIRGNSFYIGRGGWYSITGSDGVLFENNRFQGIDLQSAGGGVNTLDSSVTSSQNVLFEGNIFEHSFGWDREAITTDGPGGFYSGQASHTGARELQIGPVDSKTSRAGSWVGAGVFVVGGKGVGQWARVAERDGQRLILDRDLAAQLDPSSEITIVPFQQRYVFVGNSFTDVGAAIQTYGTALEHVIANNNLVRTDGIRIWGLVYKNHPQPAWFTQVLDNRVAGATFEGASMISIRATQRNGSKTIMNMGSIVRGNVFGANGAISLDGSSKTVLGLTNAVVEHNSSDGGDARLRIGGGVGMNIMRQIKAGN